MKNCVKNTIAICNNLNNRIHVGGVYTTYIERDIGYEGTIGGTY